MIEETTGLLHHAQELVILAFDLHRSQKLVTETEVKHRFVCFTFLNLGNIHKMWKMTSIEVYDTRI